MNVDMDYLFTRVSVLTLTAVLITARSYSLVPSNVRYYNGTANGNSKGAPCVFPFFYNGMYYNGCTFANHSRAWCGTTTNYTRDGQWGECLDYDVCLSHKTLSDPWRNIGFNLTSFPAWPMNDLNLQEGWYRFTGIGGDHMVYYCLSFILSDTSNVYLLSNNGTSAGSSAGFSLYTCDAVIGSAQNLDCGGGLTLYYLTPSNETYTTRHSSCSASSCGPNTHCNASSVPGSCVCDSELSAPVGFLTSGDSYACTDFIPGLTKECKIHCSTLCAMDLLDQIHSSPTQVISKTVVTEYLNVEIQCTKAFEDASTDENKLMLYGNSILRATEKLVSGLVMKTDTNYSISIIVPPIEVQVFVVGPNTSLKEIVRLNTSNANLDIDLIGISKNNNGSAAAAIISYSNLSIFLKPSRFIKHDGTEKILISPIVSGILINVTNPQFTQPANLTLKHTTEIDPNSSLSCVTWRGSKWVNRGCTITMTNSTHTVFSLNHPGTFALIMQIMCSPKVTSNYLYLLNTVATAVGLGFLSLTLLTFAVFRRHLKVNSTAQVNLSLSLLLAHLLFLLTQNFLHDIRATQLVCTVMAGVLHFLFLSAFVWMLIDAVLLFISAKNLTKIRSQQREVLGWKCLTGIGYLIPLAVVGVSAGMVPEGYGSNQCWIRMDKGFFWSFLGPVCFILALNLILFVAIFFFVIFTLKKLNNEILQTKNTVADKRVIKSVMFKTMAQFFILGGPWILGFFTCSSEVLEVIFLFLNSQQGTFIFLIHCVLNREVRQQCGKGLCLRKKPITSNDVQMKSK